MPCLSVCLSVCLSARESFLSVCLCLCDRRGAECDTGADAGRLHRRDDWTGSRHADRVQSRQSPGRQDPGADGPGETGCRQAECRQVRNGTPFYFSRVRTDRFKTDKVQTDWGLRRRKVQTDRVLTTRLLLDHRDLVSFPACLYRRHRPVYTRYTSST